MFKRTLGKKEKNIRMSLIMHSQHDTFQIRHYLSIPVPVTFQKQFFAFTFVQIFWKTQFFSQSTRYKNFMNKACLGGIYLRNLNAPANSSIFLKLFNIKNMFNSHALLN